MAAREDQIIFHLTTQEQWSEASKAGTFTTESLDEEGFIHCSTGDQLQATANRLFKGQEDVLLLVIDLSRLQPNVKFEKAEDVDEEFPHILGPLNLDAIIDTIKLAPEEDGTFDITVESID